MNTTDIAILTGLTEQHIVQYQDNFSLHTAAVSPFTVLCEAAKTSGIDIRIASSFRSYQRQAAIWQAKITGARTVFDQDGKTVDVTKLAGMAKLDAVLLYSALPGASRHHWGTEVDIYDAAAVPDDYKPRLLPEEYSETGPFWDMQQWLQKHAAGFGFFQPYQVYQGGVAAEPWHLSFRPVAEQYLVQFSPSTLRQCIALHPLTEQELVLEHLDTIFTRYVTNICR
ncbi:M15 family metallopeptidase [Rheinheimera aquimaris]|uniref:M15 family metallopeptidase n=1 Tax=Rheinheimera aquimaris TaxID=412437 RepID=UPI00106546A0|nr:M15 family metallopeptidase [Rheinheimera aquimaris]